MVQSLDIPDLENILVKEASLGSEKISISQQQVFVTRLMRHRADGCVSLFVSALLVSLPFIWLSFPLWHLLSLTWMRCQNSIPLLQRYSHLLLPLLSPQELFLSPLLGLARALFQFLEEMPGRHFHIKRNHGIRNKIRKTS